MRAIFNSTIICARTRNDVASVKTLAACTHRQVDPGVSIRSNCRQDRNAEPERESHDGDPFEWNSGHQGLAKMTFHAALRNQSR